MSDFDALQRAIEVSASARQAEARACEACLTALYHALRHASGPGLPLNNVSMELLPDPQQRLGPRRWAAGTRPGFGWGCARCWSGCAATPRNLSASTALRATSGCT